MSANSLPVDSQRLYGMVIRRISDLSMTTDSTPDSQLSVPRYLFRSFSPASASIGSESLIGPRAHPTPLGPHTFRILRCHLKWGNDIDSEFVSWTDSILVALVYAIRRMEGQDWRDRSGQDVRLAVLDTSRALEQVAIYPVGAILDAFLFPDAGFCKRDKFVHEYLSHGYISNDRMHRFSVAAIEDIIDRDFYSVFDPFCNPTTRLWVRVEEIRQRMECKDEYSTRRHLTPIIHMAFLFHKEFAPPVMLALVALFPIRTVPENLKRVVDCMCYYFEEIPAPYRAHPIVTGSCLGQGNEVDRFHVLLSKICHVRTEAELQ